jgi:hypothetical protein
MVDPAARRPGRWYIDGPPMAIASGLRLAAARVTAPSRRLHPRSRMTDDPPEPGNRRGADQGDRRSPHTYIQADGTLIFGDRHGIRWQVYDRRSGDRREAAWGKASFYRAFINDAGEEWRCELAPAEVIDETASTLERQLERAVRISASGPA